MDGNRWFPFLYFYVYFFIILQWTYIDTYLLEIEVRVLGFIWGFYFVSCKYWWLWLEFRTFLHSLPSHLRLLRAHGEEHKFLRLYSHDTKQTRLISIYFNTESRGNFLISIWSFLIGYYSFIIQWQVVPRGWCYSDTAPTKSYAPQNHNNKISLRIFWKMAAYWRVMEMQMNILMQSIISQ